MTHFYTYIYAAKHQANVTTTVDGLLTCFGVEHQHVGPRPQQLLEVLVIADLLYQRGHLRSLQRRRQPHLVEPQHTRASARRPTLVYISDRKRGTNQNDVSGSRLRNVSADKKGSASHLLTPTY